MLAKISEGIPDAIKQLKGAPFLAEYKYDGTRAQIHLLSDNNVKVFSRNCEDKTASMPDVVAAIQAAAEGMLPSSLLHFVLWCQKHEQGCALWHTSMLLCTTGYTSNLTCTAPFQHYGFAVPTVSRSTIRAMECLQEVHVHVAMTVAENVCSCYQSRK